MLTLEEVKNNLRIDTDADDGYLQMLIETSNAFILSTLEIQLDEEKVLVTADSRFKTLQFMLVSNWFEHRVATTSAMQQEVPFTITAMIHQLRGVGVVG